MERQSLLPGMGKSQDEGTEMSEFYYSWVFLVQIWRFAFGSGADVGLGCRGKPPHPRICCWGWIHSVLGITWDFFKDLWLKNPGMDMENLWSLHPWRCSSHLEHPWATGAWGTQPLPEYSTQITVSDFIIQTTFLYFHSRASWEAAGAQLVKKVISRDKKCKISASGGDLISVNLLNGSWAFCSPK